MAIERIQLKRSVDRKDAMEKTIERKERLEKNTQDAFDIIQKIEARNFLLVLLLSRCSYRLFETVEFLSSAMLKNAGKHEYTNQWVSVARTFLLYFYVDRFQFSKQIDNQIIRIWFTRRDGGGGLCGANYFLTF